MQNPSLCKALVGLGPVFLALVSLLPRCGVATAQPGAPTGLQGHNAGLHGVVRSGQQPITGARIQLYAASNEGIGATAVPLVSTTVKTTVNGSFNLSGLYVCPGASTLVYLVASGGNPGLGAGINNTAATLMVALGACGNLSAATSVVINEVTTVAAVWSLAPFMTSYAAVGSGSADEPKLALAFEQANLLASSSTGTASGVGLPSGYFAPVAEINTLANVLATCINSAGHLGGQSPCGLLFSAARPPNDPEATETVGAALQIAENPTANLAGIFKLAPSDSPFEPSLTSAPSSWAIAISPTLFLVYVDAQFNRQPINPNIYGIASYGLDTTFAEEIKVPNIRWGGDGTTRYNWEVDSSNAGFDWYFMGGNGETTPVPGAGPDTMVNTYKPAGAGALITIPIIPWVNSMSAWSCSFPVSVYGAQESFNPYVQVNGGDCGNSIAANGSQLTDNDITANHIPNTTTLQKGWLEHLVSTFGTAAEGGVPFYQLDNEPGGWGNTHRDVEPNGQPYSTIVSLGEEYATAIKQVDPSATVLGPSDFTLGGWIGTPSLQNNLFAGQYYLQQFAAYDQANGSRTLDYFDEHYYPQFTSVATQLASTRTLWDPTYNGGTWVEQYYFYSPMDLIPRFRQWIAQYYPGTGVSFSEYSIDSGNGLVTDAIAEADMLGIFGNQQVDLANMWSPPAPTSPIAYAFRLYRDYDGAGSQFGETSLQSASTDQTQLAVYAAQRTADGALTLVVLNKTTAAIEGAFSISNFAPKGTASVYSYTAADLTQIVSQSPVPITANTLSYSFPAYSATVIAIGQN
jgi:hypothetical protein